MSTLQNLYIRGVNSIFKFEVTAISKCEVNLNIKYVSLENIDNRKKLHFAKFVISIVIKRNIKLGTDIDYSFAYSIIQDLIINNNNCQFSSQPYQRCKKGRLFLS